MHHKSLMRLRRDTVHLLTLSAVLINCSARPRPNTGEKAESSLETLYDSVTQNEISEADQTRKPFHAEAVASWPNGEYCIMPGPSLTCPAGFRMDSISLAVPVNFGIREKYHEGGKEIPYIQLGRLGGFNLGLREYDQAYTLRLNACCRSS